MAIISKAIPVYGAWATLIPQLAEQALYAIAAQLPMTKLRGVVAGLLRATTLAQSDVVFVGHRCASGASGKAGADPKLAVSGISRPLQLRSRRRGRLPVPLKGALLGRKALAGEGGFLKSIHRGIRTFWSTISATLDKTVALKHRRSIWCQSGGRWREGSMARADVKQECHVTRIKASSEHVAGSRAAI